MRAVSTRVVRPEGVNGFRVCDWAGIIEKLDQLGFDQIIELDADGNPKNPTLKKTELDLKN